MTFSPDYRIILNRMGYYNYQRGLIFRHLDQEGGWNTHLQNCRDFILRAIDIIKPATVTVLGSGWLLDLPLPEMTERTSKVNLVDIVHPPEVVSQIAEIGNVELIENDITGGLIEGLWKIAGGRSLFRKRVQFSDIIVPVYKPTFDPGMVISLNIFTQLESLPVEFLKKKARCPDDCIPDLKRKIQENHILFLKKHPSILITDISEVVTENSGVVREIKSVLTELPIGRHREEWTWYFDLRGSDFYSKRSVFKIAAIIL